MKTKLKRIPLGISTALGTALGTALYTKFMSSTGEIDWPRALFVGAFVGLVSALWPRKN